MATSTTNYGWTKPAYEDDADIMVINGTIDAIDSQMKSIDTGKASNTLTGYSVDTSESTITTSSTVMGAIEQLDYRTATNKTNISNAEWTITEGNYSCTASNVYEYTGVSVTCPANQVLEIIAVDRRGAANCLAICIADSDSSITSPAEETVIAENNAAYSSGIVDAWTRQVVCITPDTRNTAKTYYVWVKRTSTGKNSVRLAYRRIE